MPLIVRWAEDICLKHRADAIVCCGHSGLLVAGALSYVTRIPVLAVRKAGEPQVAEYSPSVSAVLDSKAKRWVWLDDFISSGSTFRHSAAECLSHKLLATPRPEALLLYDVVGEYARPEPASSSYLGLAHLGYVRTSNDDIPTYGFRASYAE
jgi:hypothetical protein